MKVGSLVECIEGYPGAISANCYPVMKGDILTVRGIGKHLICKNHPTNYIPILFFEHTNPYCGCGCGSEMCYDARDFRELQPPMDVSIESLISEPETV